MAPCGAPITRFLGALVYSEAPDGGWGWVISVAFFIVETFTYGIIKSFGIFLQDMKEEFGETNSRVSWIVSICVFTMTFNGRSRFHQMGGFRCIAEKQYLVQEVQFHHSQLMK